MEWTDVKDSLKSLYDESCEVWDGKKDGSSFDAGHRFITESINILDGFFSDKVDQIHKIYTAIKENVASYFATIAAKQAKEESYAKTCNDPCCDCCKVCESY